MIADQIPQTLNRGCPPSETKGKKMLMTKRILLGTLVLLCALALVTPASAVTVNGTDWVLLAKTGILMEQSDDCPHILDPANLPPARSV
jgi:hypothetical protein